MTARRGEDLTLTDAARRCGVSRSTVRRALDRGDLPNAYQREDSAGGSGTWVVPRSDLEALGWTVQDSAGTVADRAGDTGADSPSDSPVVGLVPWSEVMPLVVRGDELASQVADLRVELERTRHRAEQLERELQTERERGARAAATPSAPVPAPATPSGERRRRRLWGG